MILNTVRILDTWYQDATNGINARLSGISRDAGDSLPPDVTVFNEFDDDELARREISQDKAAAGILVFAPTTADFDGFVNVNIERGAGVQVATAYYGTKEDSTTGLVDASITLRAAQQAVTALMSGNESNRLLNNIAILRVVNRQIAPARALLGDALVTLLMVHTFHVEDQDP